MKKVDLGGKSLILMTAVLSFCAISLTCKEVCANHSFKTGYPAAADSKGVMRKPLIRRGEAGQR
jgi:hypothetical protein